MNAYDDTIYALSSGPPPAGVAVIRVSGPQSRFATETLAGTCPEARIAKLRPLRGPDGALIDHGLVIFFPAPHSFTGEDCVEFHIHGGRAAIFRLLSALSVLPGLRPAEAGEFTRRAFENGRLDLTAVEGLADLIAAETEMQRRQAIELASGGLAALYDAWAARLTHCRALIEASIDFADEGDVPEAVADGIRTELDDLRRSIAEQLAEAPAREIIRDGFRVAIVGAPNAGKSSLMNALAQRDVSIVAPEPGTTRDVVTARLDIGGYMVLVQDTAGLRETDALVEREGIRRAKLALDTADLVLSLRDRTASEPEEAPPMGQRGLRVGTKSDLVERGEEFDGDVCISTKTGQGLSELIKLIRGHVESATARSANVVPAHVRQQACLRQAQEALERAVVSGLAHELVAEELRGAAHALGRITGRVDVEDLLDVIFASFCIGK